MPTFSVSFEYETKVEAQSEREALKVAQSRLDCGIRVLPSELTAERKADD